MTLLFRSHFMLRPIYILLLILLPGSGLAETFNLHHKSDSLIGEIKFTSARMSDTLLDIARENGLGVEEIKLANPHVDLWLPGENREILLPTKYVLPYAKHQGIILNIPEMRLYYFPPGKKGEPVQVETYPLGIGREGWGTPYVTTHVVQKTKHPYWIPPESIREEHEEMGEPLPARIGPGPDNPLGDYAMRLGLASYLIHGTNKPFGVGMRVSHGCIRLYPEDIEELFKQVSLGTRVQIINQPYKVGLFENRFYLEAHPYLEEDSDQFEENLTSVVKMIVGLTNDQKYDINWDLAKEVIRDARGIPVEIGKLRMPAPGLVAGTKQELKSASDAKSLELRLETSLKGE